jgi:anti-anti-sigma factor
MEVKIDTKERFQVVSLTTACFSATMAAELSQKLSPYLLADVKSSDSPGNIVLNMTTVSAIDPEGARALLLLQQQFYEHNRSFVVCSMQPLVEETFDKEELLELLNCTPTESEAWDIVQMEEIERELLDNEFPQD